MEAKHMNQQADLDAIKIKGAIASFLASMGEHLPLNINQPLNDEHKRKLFAAVTRFERRQAKWPDHEKYRSSIRLIGELCLTIKYLLNDNSLSFEMREQLQLDNRQFLRERFFDMVKNCLIHLYDQQRYPATGMHLEVKYKIQAYLASVALRISEIKHKQTLDLKNNWLLRLDEVISARVLDDDADECLMFEMARLKKPKARDVTAEQLVSAMRKLTFLDNALFNGNSEHESRHCKALFKHYVDNLTEKESNCIKVAHPNWKATSKHIIKGPLRRWLYLRQLEVIDHKAGHAQRAFDTTDQRELALQKIIGRIKVLMKFLYDKYDSAVEVTDTLIYYAKYELAYCKSVAAELHKQDDFEFNGCALLCSHCIDGLEGTRELTQKDINNINAQLPELHALNLFEQFNAARKAQETEDVSHWRLFGWLQSDSNKHLSDLKIGLVDLVKSYGQQSQALQNLVAPDGLLATMIDFHRDGSITSRETSTRRCINEILYPEDMSQHRCCAAR